MAIIVDWASFTEKQRACIAKYIRSGKQFESYSSVYSATQTKKTIQRQCSKFFNLPKVRAVVDQIQEEAIKRANIVMEEIVQGSMDDLVEQHKEEESLKIDAYWVLRRAALLADFNIRDFITVDDGGNAVYDFSDATDDDWYCIQEYTTEEIDRGKGENRYIVDKLKIKSYDKLRALELVGKHVEVQAFRENVAIEHNGEIKRRTLADFYKDENENEDQDQNSETESST